MYSSIHAIDVLEVFQELFGDITQFDQEMNELYLLKKQFTDMESYLYFLVLCLLILAMEKQKNYWFQTIYMNWSSKQFKWGEFDV